MPSPDPGTYALGVNADAYATYTYTLNGVTKHYETGENIGNGQVIIKPSTAPGKFTGTFRFNAEDENGEIINYNKGVFIKYLFSKIYLLQVHNHFKMKWFLFC